MRKHIPIFVTIMVFGAVASYAGGCIDYAQPPAGQDAGANQSPPATTATATTPAPTTTGNPFPPPPVDAGKVDPCAEHAYRGGTPNSVICPGVATCECAGPSICCMNTLDSNSGSCTALGSCRNIAIQCDGPEDCGGGVCCLQDRSGGGAACSAATSCSGEWLCRSDGDCTNSPQGPHCSPIDLGVQGVADKGLDGLVGICGK